MTPRALLELQVATLFATTPGGRLLHENDPDRSPAPRMHLAIGTEGAIVRLRADIDDDTARAVEALAAQEPAVHKPDASPRFAEDYRAVLKVSEPITAHSFGVAYRLPHRLASSSDVQIIFHDTPAGEALCAKIRAEGMPQGLVEAGFADLTHFWPPWCVALEGTEIVSIAFAARLGPRSAEVGVTTMKAFRGRGFAAATVAGWSALQALQDRALFYATHRDNLSSRRVIARLGLPFLGIRMQL